MLTPPLILGILATIAFNLAPIILGAAMQMNIAFGVFAIIVFALSISDSRVLGYAAVLTACNPANLQANLSFSFLLASLAVFREFPSLPRIGWQLTRHYWWTLFLLAVFLAMLMFPFWGLGLREMATELKTLLGRLGYITVLPLAVGLTLRSPRDGRRAVALLCLMAAALLAIFYFRGQAGFAVIRADQFSEAVGVEMSIGQISLSFLRTQVCIVLAAIAIGSLALGICTGWKPIAVLYFGASAICVLITMLQASVGSAAAMAMAVGILAMGYLGVRLSIGRIILGVSLFTVVGVALVLAVFYTENPLSARIQQKVESGQIDRMTLWQEGIVEISKTPLGEGWTLRTCHSDWLLYLLAYGWIPGSLYFIGSLVLFASMWRALPRQGAANPHSRALLLTGLAALTVYGANAVPDMLSANTGYYETVWAVILVSATVVALSEKERPAAEIVSRPRPLPVHPNINPGLAR